MRYPTIVRWLCGVSLAFSAALGARPASAEGGVSLARFNPSLAGDRLLGVPSPFVAGERAFHVMLLGDYAHNPLLAERADGGSAGAVVASQLFLHVNGTLSLFSRVSINVDVPAAIVQSGDDPADAAGITSLSPSGPQLGDIRVGARVRLFGGYFDGFQLALGGYVWLPSGADDVGSFVGDGAVRGMPELIAGGRTSSFIWAGAIGPEIRPSSSFGDVAQGTALHIRAGGGVLLGEQRRIQIGPEITFATVLSDPSESTTNAELLASGKIRFIESVEAGLGLGLGLSGGIGTPDFRGVLSVAYTPEMQRARGGGEGAAIVGKAGPEGSSPPKEGDRDGDSIADASDACPDKPGVASPEPAKNGCPRAYKPPPPPPPSDRDHDRVADPDDACPDVAGAPSETPRKNGCPADQDNDGVPDTIDACRDVPGLATGDPTTSGCPGDTDGDSVADDKDACPRERGKIDADPTKNGCPMWARVTDDAIVLLDSVKFEMGKAAILPASEALLDDVALVLKAHPEILKVEVQGHTDDRGEPRYNQKISDERAAAVVIALMQRGIEATRMISRGYGSTKPIEKNLYEAGRQKNRRIEIKITQRAP